MPRDRSYRPASPLRSDAHNRVYGVRILAALAGSLALLVGAFRLWPVDERAPDPERFTVPERETIQIELIEPTRQVAQQAPPPPPTLPPIEVPDDVVLPEEELAFDALTINPVVAPLPAPPGPPGPPTEADEEGPLFIENADVRPRIVRSAIPDYPAEAQRRDVRARVRLRVLIDERGRVLEREITERFLLDKKDREEPVDLLGYGIEEAVLEAVDRFRFRPGRHDGRPVQTYTVITLSVGV